MPEPIVISDYDPEWPNRYLALRAPIAAALGDLAVGIEHVGSTSVPGLAAKPTIDIVILVRSIADLPRVIERLERIGYVHEGDFGVNGREAFATPAGYAKHDHHLYACHPDWPGYGDQIVFRDYLRTHPAAADAYAALKRSLAIRHRDDRAAYTAAKADFVRDVLSKSGPSGPNPYSLSSSPLPSGSVR
jgi:GrpB-like predicted nucleotidyltransferase (UPF0157 family)